jgi:hypothetical protein
MASIGVTESVTGIPASGVLEEVSIETSVEVKTLRDKAGITKHAEKMGYVKKTTTARGYGDGMGILSSVSTGPMNTAKITEVKASESNEDFPKFELTSVEYT